MRGKFIKFILALTAVVLTLPLFSAALAVSPAPAQGARSFSLTQCDRIAAHPTLTAAMEQPDPGAIAAAAANRADELETSRVFYVVATDGMCTVIVLLVVVYLLVNARLLKRAARSFLGICGAAILRFGSDAAENALNGKPGEGLRTLHWAAGSILLLTSGLMIVAVCFFLYHLVSERRKTDRGILWLGYVYAAVCAATCVLSLFNGLIFSIDADNVYARAWGTGALFAFAFLCLAGICAWMVKHRAALTAKELAALLVSLAIPAAGLILQVYQPKISPANAFITVGICAAFLSLQSILFKSERLDRLRSQTELRGIAEIFTGVYSWDAAAGKMQGSVVEPEYAWLLADGALDVEKLLAEAVAPADRDQVRDFLAPARLNELNAAPEKLMRETEYREIGAHAGEWRRISLIHLPPKAPGDDGQLYMVGQNITYEKMLAEHSQALQRRMVGAAAGLYTDICEWDMEGESALRICITPKGIEEKPLDVSWRENLLRYRAAAVVPEDCELYDRILPDRIEKEPTGSTVNASFRIIQDGEYRWNAVSVRILSGEDGRRTAMYLQQDVEDDVREHNLLRDRSEHDAMTDLFNRAKLEDMKKNEYSRMDSCGVLFLDINNLKKVNDTQGHKAGDELIQLLAESVRSVTNRHVLAYRLGGDEVLVVAENCSQEEFERIQEMWRVRLNSLNENAATPCFAAMGRAWADGRPALEDLTAAADADMYARKKAMKRGRAG